MKCFLLLNLTLNLLLISNVQAQSSNTSVPQIPKMDPSVQGFENFKRSALKNMEILKTKGFLNETQYQQEVNKVKMMPYDQYKEMALKQNELLDDPKKREEFSKQMQKALQSMSSDEKQRLQQLLKDHKKLEKKK